MVDIPGAVLDDLRRRLVATRFAPDIGSSGWDLGVPTAYLRELVMTWLDDYDWRAEERSINAFQHFMATVDGVPIHVIHERGLGPTPLPIILTHGWPWTFWDFEQMIGPLTDPAAHGADARDSFDVIIPSLPGFAFSTPLTRPGVNAYSTADLWATLMTDVLGYPRFAAFGGDWGAQVTALLGHRYPELVIGIHLTSPARPGAMSIDRPWADMLASVFQASSAPRSELLAWERKRAAHIAVHTIDPQTLSAAMHDSPAGMLAWLLERRRAWSDCDGDVERVFPRDQLLTNAMLYWATDSFASSVRFYAETAIAAPPLDQPRERIVDVPTGMSLFKRDIPPGIDPAVFESMYDVRFRRVHDHGGHFAPAERPVELVDDLRTMFRPLRT